jgi:hypothetical protein
MNRIKISLADVLTVLTAVGYGYMCFLSLNFLTLGNKLESIIGGMIIALLLGGTAIAAKIFKKTSRNFKTNFLLELASLAVFTGLSVTFAWVPFPHYLAVSDQKSHIQRDLLNSITQAENIFKEYDDYVSMRKYVYESKLKSVIRSKNINPTEYINYGFDTSADDEMQLENKLFTFDKDLIPSNYKQMIKNDSIWLVEAKSSVEHWYAISIVDVINDIEANSNTWVEQLKKLSTIRELGEEASDFNYSLTFDDVKTNFNTVSNPNTKTTVLSAIAYTIILLTYIFTKRHSKSPKCKKLFQMLFSLGRNENNGRRNIITE